jgi:hypothetical protein
MYGSVDTGRRLSVHVDDAPVTRAVDGSQEAADLARISVCHHKKGQGHCDSMPLIYELMWRPHPFHGVLPRANAAR